MSPHGTMQSPAACELGHTDTMSNSSSGKWPTGAAFAVKLKRLTMSLGLGLQFRTFLDRKGCATATTAIPAATAASYEASM